MLLQVLHSPACACSTRESLIALSRKNSVAHGTLLFPENRLVYLWNKQPFHSPSLGVIHCQLLRTCREHSSIAAVTAEGTGLSSELLFSIAANADGEMMLVSIDSVWVAPPVSHAWTAWALCLAALFYLKHPGCSLLNISTMLACCWGCLGARSPRCQHLYTSLLAT